VKNTILFVALSIFYLLSAISYEYWPLGFFIFPPLVIGIIGYQYSSYKDTSKKVIPIAVPIVCMPIIYFIDSEKAFPISIIHTVIISLIVVQLWEAFQWVISVFTKKKQSKN